VAKSLLNSLRLDKGFQALGGVMRPLIKRLTENAITTKVQGIHMKDVDTIKEQLGALTCSYYALESMIYMTAGLIDIYEKQDVEMESAMVQAFAIQAMTDFVMRPMHAVGPQAVIKGEGFDRFIRDATQVAAAGEFLDTVQQFISLSGFQHAGPILNQQVVKERNPLNHPAFIFSRVFKQTSIDFPKKKFNLEEYLHPSLVAAAEFLEASILRLNAAAEILLARHGQLVISHTVENAKLAQAATLCYALFAVVSRASRSYCIGLRNADQEVHLANVFCFEKSNEVLRIAKEIDNGQYATSEHTFKIVGEKLIETKEYHLEHPTARNY
jgi:alkylation response protein AidB-like acyl-CoA dehydrogenase